MSTCGLHGEHDRFTSYRLINASSMIRIILADDHTIFQAGVAALIAPEQDIEVVAAPSTKDELTQQLATTATDVVLIDVAFADQQGIEITKGLKVTYPSIYVIGFSMVDRKETVIDMLRAGASGFLLRNANQKDLVEAIRTVASGDSYINHEVSVWLLQQLNPTSEKSVHHPGDALTAREQEVLQLIVEEHSNPEIAERLFISLRTVDTHRRHLLEKTGAKNTAGLVKYAFYQGMLSWSPPPHP